MDDKQLGIILDGLRIEENDNRMFEVKTASKAMPQNILSTMCAFANTPGGGTIILGVDEALGFEVVGVYNAKQCQQTLANYAKTEFSSRLDMTSDIHEFGGRIVVVAKIDEAVKSIKPVSIKKNHKAYIRLYDGDYELSAQDMQLFVDARGPSLFDEAPVKGSSVNDLNPDLLRGYIANRKKHSEILSQMNDDEILLRTGVLTDTGELTTAGILALGIYPQQYFPNYTIKASAHKDNASDNIRVSNSKSITGPIPAMLTSALTWVRENSDEVTVSISTGDVRNVSEYPIRSMRELIANALIHRDLNPLSMFESIALKIEDQHLILSNPGGLFGITLSELGHTGSKTRNMKLADICQYVQSSDDVNVIEKLGSGIPNVINELSMLDMSYPRFIDGGIYFTVIMGSIYGQNKALNSISGNNNNDKIIKALSKMPLSKADIERKTQLSSAQTRYALTKLMHERKVYKIGNSTGPNVKYALLDS